MKKVIYGICGVVGVGIISVMILIVWWNNSGYDKEIISLPEGTSSETADEIVRILFWDDKIWQKIETKFPNSDLFKYPHKYSQGIGWEALKRGKTSISLRIGTSDLSRRDLLKDRKEIMTYGKMIIEQGVSNYFQKRP